jgi:DNA invertase Pin-like site-specific DNA recombinase
MSPRAARQADEPLAFSYLRFSTVEQAKGDSVRRQIELRDAWLKKTGVRLDQSLTLRDEGKSAYTGAHRSNPDRHALASFLRLVEKGDIPRGSYLVVESLDRLTREHIRPALTLLLNLIEAGVRVVQLLPVEQVFDEDVEPMALMMAIMELTRGHSESRMKSERIGRSWANRKRQARSGELLATKNVPGWLRVEKGKLVPVPERVRVVKQIFQLAREGRSMVQICRVLNAKKEPTFGRSKAWGPSTVQKILRGREAVGEFQPGRLALVEREWKGKKAKVKARVPDGEPVAGYYPVVVTDAEWWAAQGAVNSRKTGHGRPTSGFWNPLAGLLTDARDRVPLYLVHQGKRHAAAFVSKRSLKGYGPPRYVSFPAEPLITEVLGRLREVDVKEVVAGLGANDEEVLRLTAERAEVAARAAALREELESGGGEVKAAVTALRNLEARETQLAADLARARAKGANPLSEAWTEAQTLLDVLATSPDPETTRDRIRFAVRLVVSAAWCLFVALPDRSRVAAVQLEFEGGRRRHYLIYHRPGVKNQYGVDKPALTSCRSFADVYKPGEFDLRDEKQVEKLEPILGRLVKKMVWGKGEVAAG